MCYLGPRDLLVDALGLGGRRERGDLAQSCPTILHDVSCLRPVAARRERAHQSSVAGLARRIELDELPRLSARVVKAVPAEIGLGDQLECSICAIGEQTPLPNRIGTESSTLRRIWMSCSNPGAR